MTKIPHLAAIAFAVTLTAQAATWDDAWRHCDAAAECEVVKNECYAWTSVNAKHKAEAQEHFNYLRPRVNCVAPKPTPQPPARCEHNQCVIG